MDAIVLIPQDKRRSRIAAARPAMDSRQRTLDQLYLRRAAVLNLIRSLEVYQRELKINEAKLVPLR